jgi:pimeloyl-ACP methyl ester carboxylesterase
MSGDRDLSTEVLALEDGRKLTYRTYGAADGYPILALHGTPGSRLKFAPADRIAGRLGLRIISLDRWGYGGTCAHPAPSLSAFGRDCGWLLDSLGIGEAGVVGISGGGPYAAAVAAVLGRRISRLALVAPVGPIAGVRLKLGDLRPAHTFTFRVLPKLPGAVRGVFVPFRHVALAAPSASAVVAVLRAAASDRRMMQDRDVRRSLGVTFREGLRVSTRGPSIDMGLFGRPWDVDTHKVECAAKVWIGTEDRNVPIPAAVGLARSLTHCELELLEGEGHFWIARNFNVVLHWLAENPSARAA